MITFTYDGFNFSSLVTVHEIVGRGTLSSEADSISVRGRDGVYMHNKRRKERFIDVKMSLKSTTPTALRTLADSFNDKMDLDYAAPLVFSDEPTREYMAFVVGDVDWEEVRAFAILTIKFVCPDPYKYGPPTTTAFTAGAVAVTNSGTAPTSPVIEATVNEDITYMDVFNNDGYMRIGQPVPVGSVKFSPKTSILVDPMENLIGWSAAGTIVDGGAVSGTFGTTGSSLYATSFGTATAGKGWHGPAIKRSLVGGTLADFEVEWKIYFPYLDGKKRGRIELYLLDDQSNVIAKMAMKRIGGPVHGNMVEVRIGTSTTNYFMINHTAADGRAWNEFSGIIRLSRRDNFWEAYVAQVETNGKHHTRMRRIYKDSERIHMANLAQVQLHSGRSATTTTPVSNMYSTHLKVFRLNTAPTDIPVIASAGDTITFDFPRSLVAINGEPRPDLKDFGARFFKLPKGVSSLLIEPSESLTATLTKREAFK